MPRVSRVRSGGRTNGEAPKNGRASSSSISLPDEMNDPPETLAESICMIYGEKSVGKTSLANEFENAYTFMYESGRRNLKIRQVPKKGEPKLNWERTQQYTEAFIDSDYDTLVIDTIDGFYLRCFDSICAGHNVKSPIELGSDAPGVWDEIAFEFVALLALIQESGKGLVILSHSKPRSLQVKKKGLKRDEKEESTVAYDRLEPTCKPAAFRYIQEVCDFVFYYGYHEGYRAITVRDPHNIYWTGCGLADRFLDPDGKPIETFKVSSVSSEKAYQDLLSAYNNELYDIDYVPPSTRTRTTTLSGRGKK